MKIQKLNSHTDLSKAKGSTTQIINDNIDKINACTSKEELINLLENNLFKGMTAQGAKRIIYRAKRALTLVDAQDVCYQSMLYGSGNGTI